MSAVWEAAIVGGDPVVDGDEVTEVQWFTSADMAAARLGPFCRATFRAIGWLPA